MPTFRNGDATLYYEVHGKGFPILTFAPLGLESNIPVWDLDLSPIKPVPLAKGKIVGRLTIPPEAKGMMPF